MPIFEFECSNGHRSEELVGMTADGALPPMACKCGAPLKKLPSRARGVIPPWMTDENIGVNAEHRRHMTKMAKEGRELERDHIDDVYDTALTDDYTPGPVKREDAIDGMGPCDGFEEMQEVQLSQEMINAE